MSTSRPPDTYEYEYAFLLTRIRAASAQRRRRQRLGIAFAIVVVAAVGVIACQTPAILTAPQPGQVCYNYERECVAHRGWCCDQKDDCGGDVPGCQGDDCCYAGGITDVFGARRHYPMRHRIIETCDGGE